MDTLELIELFKYLNALIAGGLGILAVFGNYVRHDGKLSALGYAVIFGIVFSTSIMLLTTLLDTHQTKVNERLASERNARLLYEQHRTQNPIDEITLKTYLSTNTEHFDIDKEYVDATKKIIEQRLKNPNRPFIPDTKSMGFSIYETDDEGTFYLIDTNSDLFPKEHKKGLGFIATNLGYEIQIRKEHISEIGIDRMEEDSETLNRPSVPDLVAHPFPAKQFSSQIALHQNSENVGVIITLKYKRDNWVKTPIVSTVPDLHRSQIIFLRRYDTAVNWEWQELQQMFIFLKSIELLRIELAVAHGKWIICDEYGIKTSKSNRISNFVVDLDKQTHENSC